MDTGANPHDGLSALFGMDNPMNNGSKLLVPGTGVPQQSPLTGGLSTGGGMPFLGSTLSPMPFAGASEIVMPQKKDMNKSSLMSPPIKSDSVFCLPLSKPNTPAILSRKKVAEGLNGNKSVPNDSGSKTGAGQNGVGSKDDAGAEVHDDKAHPSTPEAKKLKTGEAPQSGDNSAPLFDGGQGVSPVGLLGADIKPGMNIQHGKGDAKTPTGGACFLNCEPFTPGVILNTPNGMSLNGGFDSASNDFDRDVLAGLLPTGTPHTPQGQAIPDTVQNDIVSQLLLLSQGNTPKVGGGLQLGSPSMGGGMNEASNLAQIASLLGGNGAALGGPSAHNGGVLDQVKNAMSLGAAFPGLTVDVNKALAAGSTLAPPRQPVFSPGGTNHLGSGPGTATNSSKHTTPASAAPSGAGTVEGCMGGGHTKPTDKRSNKRKRSEHECKLDSLDHVRVRFPNHSKRAWVCTNCEPVRTIKTYDWVAKCVHCKHCRRCSVLIRTSHHAVCPFCEKGCFDYRRGRDRCHACDVVTKDTPASRKAAQAAASAAAIAQSTLMVQTAAHMPPPLLGMPVGGMPTPTSMNQAAAAAAAAATAAQVAYAQMNGMNAMNAVPIGNIPLTIGTPGQVAHTALMGLPLLVDGLHTMLPQNGVVGAGTPGSVNSGFNMTFPLHNTSMPMGAFPTGALMPAGSLSAPTSLVAASTLMNASTAMPHSDVLAAAAAAAAAAVAAAVPTAGGATPQ